MGLASGSRRRGQGTAARCRHPAVLLSTALLLASQPTIVAASQGETPQFTDVAADVGLRFRHNFGAERVEDILMTTGSGVALVDYDGDGWLDALLVNGTRLDREGRVLVEGATSHAFFRNSGDGTFAEATVMTGLGTPSYGLGVTSGDFDGDGFTDLYLTNYGANRLYRNRGDGTFEDITESSGTAGAAFSTGAVFFDYDGDRDLDLYVANYLRFRPDMDVHASSLSKRGGMGFFPSPRDYEAESDVLYRNEGDGRSFADVSVLAGLRDGGKGFMPVAADFDEDGDQDLFVANDATENHVYRNDGGHLVEIGLESGAAYDPQGVETGAMGVDIADIDGDGLQDLYVTNFIFEHNNLYRNLGNLSFTDVTRALKLDKDNYRYVGWATRFADFNHDGVLDCFVANGHVTDYVEGFSQDITYGQRNLLFLGDGKGEFVEVGRKAGEPFRARRVNRGAAFGDFDNDGDIDILLQRSGGRAELLRNELPANDRWIKVRLRGNPPNRHGIGARVRVILGGESRVTEVRFPGTYLSSSDPTLHQGLPPGIDEVAVEVTWPSGARSRVDARAGAVTVIREPGTAPAVR